MDQLIPPPGYKIKLIKIGLTEAQKRAMNKYEAKNKERRNEARKERNRIQYNTDSEYKLKTQDRMRDTMRHKKIMAELPNL